MGDPLSIAASIIAVLQLAETVIDYLQEASKASREWERILNETNSLYVMLNRLNFQADNPEWDKTMSFLKMPNGPLDQITRALERLASKLKPAVGETRREKARKSAGLAISERRG
jgi:hypothetical protein